VETLTLMEYEYRIPQGKKVEKLMNKPVFSVVMPAYNAERYVGEAIVSVLAQTLTDWELLVVNDCSTDRTLEVCNSFQDPRIRVFSTPQNLNAAGARNLALEHARGEFIAFLDSDDVALPDRLERQLRAFHADPDLGFIGSAVQFLGERPDSPQPPWVYPEANGAIQAEMLFRCPFLMSTVAIKATILKILERPAFTPEFAPCEDYHFGVRLVGNCKFRNDSRPVSFYRLHSSQLNFTQRDPMAVQISRVQKYLLNRMGLKVNKGDMELHQACIRGDFPNLDQLGAAGKWLEEIHRANLSARIIPDIGIRSLLGGRWFGLCKQFPQKSMRLFMTFKKSKLSGFYRSRREKFRFLCECLLEARIGQEVEKTGIQN
jgi:glycosyltransferase involved in cell wall biosynthesis